MSPMFGIPQKEGASKTPVVNFKLIVVVTLLRKVIDNVRKHEFYLYDLLRNLSWI